jgi:hypothetical protein
MKNILEKSSIFHNYNLLPIFFNGHKNVQVESGIIWPSGSGFIIQDYGSARNIYGSPSLMAINFIQIT